MDILCKLDLADMEEKFKTTIPGKSYDFMQSSQSRWKSLDEEGTLSPGANFAKNIKCLS